MKKLLSIAILSVSALALSSQQASAWWPFHCSPCYMKVNCRQYNAFSPFCCDTACFSGCGLGNGPQPIAPWNYGYHGNYGYPGTVVEPAEPNAPAPKAKTPIGAIPQISPYAYGQPAAYPGYAYGQPVAYPGQFQGGFVPQYGMGYPIPNWNGYGYGNGFMPGR